MNDLMRLTNDKLPEEQRVEHEIQVKVDSDPVKQKTRGIPYSFREDFKKTILEMKAAGMIIDSKSPWCSPVRLVKKKDGTIRVCVDFRKVNTVTIKDAYPIQKIEDLFTYLTGAFVFSTLDLASGYYQVRMKPKSQQYTAFSCEFGFYEYVAMPMGLTNACATFQRLMNGVLDGLIGKCCLVYLDDIIIFSNNVQDHLNHVKLVSQRLRDHNLKIKLSKCKFAQTQVEYLSHIISNGCIKPNPLKVASVTDFKRPTNVKGVQSFLGLVSYYRKFIRDCANLCSPLICLTTKPKAFEWTESCEYAFKLLKGMLVSVDNVLILPDYEQSFRVEADASKFGVGGVLSQQRDGQWKPVAYFSKHLSKTESNYSASEREMLAIVLSVERFKQYVYGREFVILSDHQPLKYLLTADVPDARLARLLNRLRIYNYTIDYRMGSKHGNADALSRMVDEDEVTPLVDNLDNENNIVINAIQLRSDTMNRDQLKDENLKWMYDLKQRFRETGIKPTIDTFDSVESKSLYSQWNRIYVFNHNLFREFIDSDYMNRNKIRHDRHVRAANFELHDLVWVLDTTVKKGLSKKFARKWTGPYKILAKINDVNYELQPVKKRGKKLIMHVNRLQKCFTRNYIQVTDFREMVVKPKPLKSVPKVNLEDSIFTQEFSTSVVVPSEAEDTFTPLYEPPRPLFDDGEIDDIIEDIGALGDTTAEPGPHFDDYWEDLAETTTEVPDVDVAYQPNSYYQQQLQDDPVNGILRVFTC